MPSFDNVLMIFFLILCPILGWSQHPSSGRISKKIVNLVKSAEDALLNNQLEEAEVLYLKAIAKKSDYAVAKRGLSAVYQLQGRYQLSAELLAEIISEKPYFSRVIYAETAIAFFSLGNYDLAEEYFNQFEKIVKLPVSEFGINGGLEFKYEGNYVKQLAKNIKACQLGREASFSEFLDSISNLGSPINSPRNEYFPFLTNDGSQMYFTRRDADENLFVSSKKEASWSIPVSVDSIFNTQLNEGMATLTRDGRSIYFTACQRASVQGTCDIQRGTIVDGQIASIQTLTGSLNSDRWESQACVSCDGRSIFFATNRMGGFGSTDIYSSQLQADFSWSTPKNLGPNINTSLDEEAPFITDDGQTLFFSSTGHIGLGEQDIFMSQLQENGEWGIAVNLGKPINSGYRELGFYLTGDGRTGYFSSNRPNGEGDMDIYQFNLKKELPNKSLVYLEGCVKDSVTGLPIQTVLHTKDNLSIPTDEKGRFFRCLIAEEIFSFDLYEKNYQPFSFTKNITPKANQNTYHLDILLSPIIKDLTKNSIPAVLPKKITKSFSIYFQFDAYHLDTLNQNKLNKLVEALDRLSISNIEIIGYTDAIGSTTYNKDLSKKRAESVANFLKQSESQIVTSKITLEGRGVFQHSTEGKEQRKVEITWTQLN